MNAQVVVSKVTKQGMVGAKWGPVGQVVYLGQGKVWENKGSRWVGKEQGHNSGENGGQTGPAASKWAAGWYASLAELYAWSPLFIPSSY